ncbi:hypothetical protein [Dehalobacter restrictus]|uniref:RCC1 domain-containing protein n=1 Tax=Dehalobacter restrictus TaxID=55583 RepID=UPI00338E0AEC
MRKTLNHISLVTAFLIVGVSLLFTGCSSPDKKSSEEAKVTAKETTIAASIPNKSVRVAAGTEFSMCLKADGSVWTWGSDYSGQLGNGTMTPYKSLQKPGSVVPEKIIDSDVTSVSAGQNHAMALKKDGSVWGWGENLVGQVGVAKEPYYTTPQQIVANGCKYVSAGYKHTVALMSDGSVWAWGMNNYGQLGDGTTTNSTVPKKVIDSGVIAITAGDICTFAIKSDGSLWAWGGNEKGLLGIEGAAEIHTPKKVIEKGVKKIDTNLGVNGYFTVAIRTDNSLWAWGELKRKEISTPRQILSGNVMDVAAGGGNILVNKSDGSLWAWYFNYGDRLGSKEPEEIFDRGVTDIAVGEGFYIAMKADGTVWTWGRNVLGRLGNGTTNDSVAPNKIM